MADMDELTKRVRRLSLRATQAKLELHDLAEELPLRWEEIPEVAARTHGAFEALDAAQRELAEAATRGAE